MAVWTTGLFLQSVTRAEGTQVPCHRGQQHSALADRSEHV